MKDSLGNVIYIGKAVNLKRRVGQYFMNSYKTRASNPKIASLVDCIADFEFLTPAATRRPSYLKASS